jgi:hypothetical protein
MHGGDPSQGVKATGSTKEWDNDSDVKGFFYLFKDSDMPRSRGLLGRLTKSRMLPSLHTYMSGYNLVRDNLTINKPYLRVINYIVPLFSTIGGLVNIAITPTLRFRFSDINSNGIENDTNYPVPEHHPDRGHPTKGYVAYRTAQRVEAWRIGLLGSIIVGLKTRNIKANPSKTLTGIVQLTCAVALCALKMQTIVACPAAFVVGMMLA